MCGITGFNFLDKKQLTAMNKAIAHRGPDGTGSFFSKDLSMGHVRLSIIDVNKRANQPLYYRKQKGASNADVNLSDTRHSDYVLVFNGEIYNYKELREELEKQNYVFSTESDTEVLLAAYDHWGKDCLKKCNGMWSFALYDKKKNKVFLSVDRRGQKPLYYYYKDGVFIFASELKSILTHTKLNINKKEHINKEAIELYFSTGHIPAPLTAFKDCQKLQAGHCIEYDCATKQLTAQQEYYTLPTLSPKYNPEELIVQGKELLHDAVKLRMRSDVPIGVFLSGGLDSSTVVSQMRSFTDLDKLHTFSMGFEGRYDETKYIDVVQKAFGTKHHHVYFKEKQFKTLMSSFADTYDEPFWDYSSFPLLMLSKEARKKVTVVLSGDGGDEVFGGYTTHHIGYLMELLRKVPRPLRWLGAKLPFGKRYTADKPNMHLFVQACKLSLYPKIEFLSRILEDDIVKTDTFRAWSTHKLGYALKKGKNNLSEGLRIYDLLFNTLQNNFLVKGDRTTMQHSLELRSPFLDYRFAEFAQTIPTSQKLGLRSRKKLLKQMIVDLVPQQIITNRKQGFEPPFEEWIKKHVKYTAEDVEQLLGAISPELVQEFTTKIIGKSGRLVTRHLIYLYLFEVWYKKWVTS